MSCRPTCYWKTTFTGLGGVRVILVGVCLESVTKLNEKRMKHLVSVRLGWKLCQTQQLGFRRGRKSQQWQDCRSVFVCMCELKLISSTRKAHGKEWQ